MPLWLVKIISDFARWRSRACAKRAGRAIARGQFWLRFESNIIRRSCNGKA